MQRARVRRRASGFTAVEMIVVVAIVGILLSFGVPLIQRTIHRVKMESIVQESFILIQTARSEAIKQNVDAVVRVDFATGEIAAFADLHGNALEDPADGVFNPIDGEPNRTTDYRLAAYPVPVGIDFVAPAGLDPIDGFTEVDTPDGTEQVAILRPDGSIDAIGAFRLGDTRGNFFEVRISPRATARVQVRKWDPDEEEWRERGENDEPWSWT